MAATNYNPYLGMNQCRNPAGPPSNFTFTTPTQCTTLGTPRPCIETISPINLSAPGVGASWQHSIPTTMPWVDMTSVPQNMPGPVGSATVFTGLPFNILSGPASVSNSPPRRSKRKALDLPSEGPALKVHLCADQLANMRITPSHHVTYEAAQLPDQQYGSSSEQFEARLGHYKPADRSEEWERFRELEDRLTTECDDESDSSFTEDSSKEGIQIRVADAVVNVTGNNSPILPRKIMEDIHKPCMQIVLWQSPEALISNNISTEDNRVESQSTPESSSASTSSLNLPSDSSSTPQVSISSSDPTNMAANSHGISSMEAIASGPIFNSQRSSIIGSDAPFQSSSFTRQGNPACRLSPSPDFLRPLSSSSGSPFSSFSSSSSFFPPSIGNPVNFAAPHHEGNYVNNNNILSNNNTNNVTTMFDSVDDEMQL